MVNILIHKKIEEEKSKMLDEKCIQWIKKMNACIDYCSKKTSCRKPFSLWCDIDNMYEICKNSKINNYNKNVLINMENVGVVESPTKSNR